MRRPDPCGPELEEIDRAGFVFGSRPVEADRNRRRRAEAAEVLLTREDRKQGHSAAASPSALSAAIYELDAADAPRWRWSPWILGRQISWDQVRNPTPLIPMEG